MRFLADGPNIPDQLLEDRDNGNVVFFCGAGVSRPAGLPGFVDLAEQVVHELGAPPEAKVRRMLARAKQEPDGTVPLDQVFSVLQQEYRSTNINAIVGDLLKTSSSANIDQHQTILRLSRNAAHQVQIVTTNFDLLFERADKTIQRHVAPALPDLSSGQRLTGLVYLHGRLNSGARREIEPHQLILSSSDFGRAYLADAWATRFVRDLLKNYVIVLLGYSANDPPVRYLLEGLHARATQNSERIYAFDQGTEAEVSARWRGRGVISLAYPESSNHSALWDSLGAWAGRADDPELWRRSVFDLASSNPRNLAPHERGQIFSLVRTTEGAKLFANTPNTPPAEWICVFDKNVRYGEPLERENKEPIDPLTIYGLDDDPPRSTEEDNGALSTIKDALSSSPFDEQKGAYSRLAGISESEANPISPRLFHISRWFGKVMGQSASIWWAAGYYSLHPGLKNQIDWFLNHSDIKLGPKARHTWEILTEKFELSPKQANLTYHVAAKIKRRGWSAQIHYELEAAIQPFLTSRRPFRSGPIPPEGNCEEIDVGEIINLEVKFPARGANELTPPAEDLYRLFRSVRRGLEKAQKLLEAIETRYWHTASFQTDQRPGERYLSDSDVYLFWAKRLFDQLCDQQPAIARSEVVRWPWDDAFFFDKLKLHAWTNRALFSGDLVGGGLTDLRDEGFWDGYNRRELLHLLRDRWTDIPPETRDHIENRIIAGRSIRNDEDAEESRKRNSSTAASVLGWLRRNGCTLSDQTIRILPSLQLANPSWTTGWEESADGSLDGRTGFVAIKDDPAKIIDVPISKIIEVAEKNSTRPFMEFTEHRPFSGLVKQRPQRALAALAYQARRGNFPLESWKTALADWPENLSQRHQCLFAMRVARLPMSTISQLPHYAPQWLKKNLPTLAKADSERALAVWDSIFTGLTSGEDNALQSGLGEMSVGGRRLDRSRRTYDHAINGPVGHLTETLFEILDDRKLKARDGIPDDIKERLERALSAPGEGADHAICETGIRLNWLYYLDPSWVTAKLLPMFVIDSHLAEPAWNGFLHSQNLSPPGLFTLLKPHFLNVFASLNEWHWDSQSTDRLHEFLVVACYWHKKSKSYISFADTRLALQRSDDDGRSHALWFLGSLISEQHTWKFGKEFILKAWPKEVRYQTTTSSRQFTSIVENSGDDFPDVVRTISPFLVPSSQLDLFVYKTTEREDDSEEGAAKLPRKFPSAMLALLDRLVADDPSLAPFELASLVNTLAHADASLRQDRRWRRLSRIAQSR